MENLVDLPMDDTLTFELPQPSQLIIVISGLSGAGKDTVIKELKDRQLPFHFVVTAASRKPRAEEKEGVDYYFVTRERFEEMLAANELIEHAVVYGEYKGVPKFSIERGLESGKDVVLRVDVQGASTIRKMYPHAILIFITPPDANEWIARLKGRGTEGEEQFKARIEKARWEQGFLPEFDYIVVNRDGCLKWAADQVMHIIEVEHLRRVPRGAQQ